MHFDRQCPRRFSDSVLPAPTGLARPCGNSPPSHPRSRSRQSTSPVGGQPHDEVQVFVLVPWSECRKVNHTPPLRVPDHKPIWARQSTGSRTVTRAGLQGDLAHRCAWASNGLCRRREAASTPAEVGGKAKSNPSLPGKSGRHAARRDRRTAKVRRRQEINGWQMDQVLQARRARKLSGRGHKPLGRDEGLPARRYTRQKPQALRPKQISRAVQGADRACGSPSSAHTIFKPAPAADGQQTRLASVRACGSAPARGAAMVPARLSDPGARSKAPVAHHAGPCERARAGHQL